MESNTLYVPDRAAWRAWLDEHHLTRKVIWLVYYKAHSGKPRIPYDHAVEEALCFGWIDSTIKRVDDDKYMQKFTPRTNIGKWSDLNKRRVAKLVKEGRMTAAGLAKCDFDTSCGPVEAQRPLKKKELPIPPAVKKALMASPKAWAHLQSLAPSYRRQYIGWITSAKKEETQLKRVKEAIGLLTEGKKLGMK